MAPAVNSLKWLSRQFNTQLSQWFEQVNDSFILQERKYVVHPRRFN